MNKQKTFNILFFRDDKKDEDNNEPTISIGAYNHRIGSTDKPFYPECPRIEDCGVSKFLSKYMPNDSELEAKVTIVFNIKKENKNEPPSYNTDIR